jgi:hypothetical protein
MLPDWYLSGAHVRFDLPDLVASCSKERDSVEFGGHRRLYNINYFVILYLMMICHCIYEKMVEISFTGMKLV